MAASRRSGSVCARKRPKAQGPSDTISLLMGDPAKPQLTCSWLAGTAACLALSKGPTQRLQQLLNCTSPRRAGQDARQKSNQNAADLATRTLHPISKAERPMRLSGRTSPPPVASGGGPSSAVRSRLHGPPGPSEVRVRRGTVWPAQVATQQRDAAQPIAHGVLVDGDERVEVLLQGLLEQCLAACADIAAEARCSLTQHARLADR